MHSTLNALHIDRPCFQYNDNKDNYDLSAPRIHEMLYLFQLGSCPICDIDHWST